MALGLCLCPPTKPSLYLIHHLRLLTHQCQKLPPNILLILSFPFGPFANFCSVLSCFLTSILLIFVVEILAAKAFSMSKEEVMRAWEEYVIEKGEKGNRTIHYVIRDTTGYHLLAVVGIQRAGEDMIYTIARDFIRVFGSSSDVDAGKRWQTRREVVEWLVSIVSKRGPILADPRNQQLLDTTPSLRYLMSMMARFSTRGSPSSSDEEIKASSAMVKENADIVWSGDSWTCCKQLKHYPVFSRCGTDVPVYSFVWIKGEGGKAFIGYNEDMYEDQQGEKMVRVRWINFPEEISLPIPNLNSDGGEIFMTSIEQEISAECIDGLAAVLTPCDFEKCYALLPRDMSVKSYFCHREVVNRCVRPFCLSELRGYSTQPILQTMKFYASRKCKDRKNPTQDLEGSAPEETEVPSPKGNEHGDANKSIGNQTPSVLDNQGQKCETSGQQMKTVLSSKSPMDNNLVVSETPGPVPFKVDENIELLSQDSGLRGCWFRCKILRSSKKFLRVQYYDVDNMDGTGKLEESVPAARVANPDNLGIRCRDRLTVRPWPADDSPEFKLEVGVAVDARWHDGWWEGVVIGCDPSASTNLQVYLPGESKFLAIERSNVRVSKDWIDNRWVNVNRKTDILSFLTSILNPAPNLPPLPDLGEAREAAASGPFPPLPDQGEAPDAAASGPIP